MPELQPAFAAIYNQRRSLRTWEDRIHDPSLTVPRSLRLLVLRIRTRSRCRSRLIVRIPSRIIDPAIAASIVYVVAGNSISRGFEERWHDTLASV
jgi:hypothetical protein